MNWLVYGAHGWIGSYLCDYIHQHYPDINLVLSYTRVDNIVCVRSDLDDICPDRVICLIGRTSGPGCNSIDYLEGPGKLVDNIRDNLFSPLVLMKLCEERNIHLTYLGTGCIFIYNDPSDPPFTEQDEPNFTGSSYSTVKGFTDQLTTLFNNTLNVRIRMPIVSVDHPKNLLSKLIRYPKICNSLNSVTVLDDAIPALVKEIINRRTGTLNLVNPGPVDHVTILQLYQKYVDPNHKYILMEETEQDKMLQSKRSKNTMTASLDLPPAIVSIERIFQHFIKSE